MTIAHLPLNEIAMEMRSGFACGEEDPQGIAQFRMNNVTRDGAIDWTKIRRVPAEKFREEFRLRDGDILFNATNSPELVGKTAVYAEMGEVVAFSNHFIRVRVDQARAVPAYVGRWLQKLFSERKFQGMCRQWVNQASISKEQLANVCIPLPPLDEQRRIAAILDQADALRRKRDQSLDEIDRLVGSDFLSCFAGNAASDWPVVRMEDVSSLMRTGPFGSQLLHSEFVDSGIAVLGIDNAVQNEFAWDQRRYITEAKFKELSRFRVFPKDVIITIMGTCGRAAVVPDDIPLAITTKHLCCITLDTTRCLPEFLHACFLRHPAVLQRLGVSARGAVMPGLNMGLIKAIEFPLPPLGLQQAFAARVTEIRKLSRAHRAHAAKLDLLFTSLQHRAFRGEL